jgi:hypothetical protein
VRLIKIFKKNKHASQAEFDMSTKLNRECIVCRDWEEAKNAKIPITEQLKMLDDYYNGEHYSKEQLQALAEKNGWYFVPPVLTDCFKVVEQSIDTDAPDFLFMGRDDDLDSTLAKERQDLVNYVVYNNHLDEMMSENERNLGKAKNAFWKVSWDSEKQFGSEKGDIVIGNPDPANIFPDPSAYTIDDCEYLIYAYRMHIKKARRVFGAIIDEIATDNLHCETEIYNQISYDNISSGYSSSKVQFYDNTIQVLEYWFKQPDDGKVKIDKVNYSWKAGDIACCIIIDKQEVKYIPNYWQNTCRSGNQYYPFVKYERVGVSKSFWSRSDIENIKDLVEAGDKELMSTLLNNMYNSQDIIIQEEEALADGDTISNEPGSVITVRQGKMGAVKRLGNTANSTNSISTINWIQNQIEETNGNSGINAGEKPPSNVNTFSGMALLAEQGQKRVKTKMAPRNLAFRRLYELIDWHVLEFYNTDRVLTVRGKDGISKMFKFNSDKFKTLDNDKFNKKVEDYMNSKDGMEMPDKDYYKMREEMKYYPRIDTEIILTDPIAKSRAMAIQASSEIMKSLDNLNPIKAKLLKSQVELMGLPNQQEIFDAIDEVLKQIEEAKKQEEMLKAQALQQQQAVNGGQPPNNINQGGGNGAEKIQQMQQMQQQQMQMQGQQQI